MRRLITMRRLATVLLLGAGSLALDARGADAQQVYFEGFTNGCFYLSSASGCSPETAEGTRTDRTAAEGGSGRGLEYVNSSFSGTTLDWSQPLELNFGTFNLLPVLYDNLFNDRFVLRTSFSVPVAQSQLFFADIYGGVVWRNGAAYIDFSDSPIAFGASGEYSIWVNDVVLGQGVGELIAPESQQLRGFVTANGPGQVTPEPISMVLLGSGLAGIGAVRRRRRNNH